MNNISQNNNSYEYGIYELCRLRKSSDIRNGREYLKLPVPLIRKIAELSKCISFFVIYDNKKHEFTLHEDRTLNHLRTLLEGPEKKEIIGFSNQLENHPNVSLALRCGEGFHEIHAKKPSSYYTIGYPGGMTFESGEELFSYLSQVNKENTLKDVKFKDKDNIWVVKVKTEGSEKGTLYIG